MNVLVKPIAKHCFLGFGYTISDSRPSIVPFDVFTQDKITRGFIEVIETDIVTSDDAFELLWDKDQETALEKLLELEDKLAKDAKATKAEADKAQAEADKAKPAA